MKLIFLFILLLGICDNGVSSCAKKTAKVTKVETATFDVIPGSLLFSF